MQTLKFVERLTGVSKKGKDYDMTKVSNGVESFILSNAPGIGAEITQMELQPGDDFEVEVHVNKGFEGLRGTIVKVSQ